MRSAKVPAVDLSVIRDDIKLPRVAGDHRRIGQLGAEHFLERGFRQFAWFSTLDDNVTRLRWLGFSAALGRAGFAGEPWVSTAKAVDEWLAKRNFLVQRLQAVGKPVGVACFHDADAANVLDACDEANLSVPDEVAILGSDNNKLICETVRVPLSSVNHDLFGLGYEGAALLQQLMLGRRGPKRLKLIPPKGITVRHSTDVLAIRHEPLRQALLHLKQNCARSVSLDDTAAAAGLPRRRLEGAFREHLGHSMVAELARLRLQRAKAMLVESNYSMADIAARAGFNSAQYFNNVFRRATGLTPRRYRLKFR